LLLICLAIPLYIHAQVDLVAIHGKVRTENPLQAEAEAIAVAGHHIVAVGTIDAVTPNNPVWVNRSDGHMRLANALAMKFAGITKDTHDIPGGLSFAIKSAIQPAFSRMQPRISPNESCRRHPMHRSTRLPGSTEVRP
jgi:predicted amidohydrolase YtcJ